jgi:hypothetical protein
MANEKNLKPLTTEKAREIGKKGGIASGKAKRQRKALKEELILLLSEKDIQKSIATALIDKALNGDTKAFEVIRDTIGEKPTDKVEVAQDKAFEVKIEVIK